MRRRKPAFPKLASSVPADWSKSLRDTGRAKLLRGLAHVGLLVLLVGVPYARGFWRARAAQHTHEQVTTCMYGGAGVDQRAGVLRDPSGAYAAMVLRAEADWPARCEPPLRELAREPALFLFPSVKSAEADVQKAAQIVLKELAGFPAPPLSGAMLPLRPLWGLEMLRNAMAGYAEAVGVSFDDTSAQASPAAPHDVVPTPTLLDIDAARDASLELWGNESTLQVAAFDARGISYMRVGTEDTIRVRLPRSGSLRGAVRQDAAAFLVWTTAFDKCGATHCAERSMGLRPMPVPWTKIPEPRWVAAHPFGSPSRSVAWQGARMWIAAANVDGTARLVELDYAEPPAAAHDQPPLEPVARTLDHARDLVVYADASGALGALALEAHASGRRSLVQVDAAGAARRLAELPETWSASWLRTCQAVGADGVETRYFVVGDGRHGLVGHVREGVAKLWSPFEAAIPAPSRIDRDPALALACDAPDAITLAFVAPSGALESLSCAEDRSECAARTLAELATGVAATRSGERVLVAYSGAPREPQVRLLQLDLHGAPLAEPTVPGPCWERWGGMCGEPTFARAGSRLVLAARSGAALMALESSDSGETWSELRAGALVKPPSPHVLPRVALR